MPKRKNYFESETMRSLRKIEDERADFMYFRVPDTNMIRQVSDKIISIKSPCDYIAVYRGRAYFIECKSTKNTQRYDLRYIKPHQLEYLLKVEACGGKGWFLVCSRGGHGRIRAWGIHPKTIQGWIASGIKSVRFENLTYSIRLERLQGLWNLKPLFLIR